MTDLNLHHGLDLLADEAEPAPVDAYDVIARAKARTRNRRATMATSLAVVTVAGAMIATIGLDDSPPRPLGGAPPSHTSTATTSSSTARKPIYDERSRHFTQVLAEAWPAIAPAGVTVEASEIQVEVSDLPALEFGGSPITSEQLMYVAQAKLSDAQGSTEFRISIFPPGQDIAMFIPGDPGYRQLEDGTLAHVYTDPDPVATAVPTVIAAFQRPDGTTFSVEEDNSAGPKEGLTRPTTFFTAEDLLQFGRLFTY